MRRVVVTGLGLVTPFGNGVNINWTKLIAGNTAFSKLTGPIFDTLPAKVAAFVPRGTGPHQYDENTLSHVMSYFI